MDPIEKLKRKNVLFVWGPMQQKAFEELKFALTQAPILAYPDWTKEFIVETDWSSVAIGAILSQVDDQGRMRAVSFISQRLSESESHYHSTEGEAMAIVYALHKFEPYLWGKHFTLITDCSAATALKKPCFGKSQLTR